MLWVKLYQIDRYNLIHQELSKINQKLELQIKIRSIILISSETNQSINVYYLKNITLGRTRMTEKYNEITKHLSISQFHTLGFWTEAVRKGYKELWKEKIKEFKGQRPAVFFLSIKVNKSVDTNVEWSPNLFLCYPKLSIIISKKIAKICGKIFKNFFNLHTHAHTNIMDKKDVYFDMDMKGYVELSISKHKNIDLSFRNI